MSELILHMEWSESCSVPAKNYLLGLVLSCSVLRVVLRELNASGYHTGNGEFGEVYLANHVVGTETANNGDEVDVEEKRAVKTLRPDLPQHIAKTFASEALLHVGLKHQNIVNVVGVCMVQQPYLFVLEYCMYGDLRKVLKTFKSRELELTLGEQAHILAQIADAMAYITKSRIAHMDLASRNVLVHQGTTMKVADFGLAHRYTKKKDHYALRGKIRLPFLWVPPECLPCSMWDATVKTPYEPRFNEQTDMWSFGVLIWEVLNYGDIPYNFGENLKPILEKVSERKMKHWMCLLGLHACS